MTVDCLSGPNCCEKCVVRNLSFDEHPGYDYSQSPEASATYDGTTRTDSPVILLAGSSATITQRTALLFDVSDVNLLNVETAQLKLTFDNYHADGNNDVQVFAMKIGDPNVPVDDGEFDSEIMSLGGDTISGTFNSGDVVVADLISEFPPANDSPWMLVYLAPDSGTGGMQFSSARLELHHTRDEDTLDDWDLYPITPAPTPTQVALLTDDRILDDDLTIASINEVISDLQSYVYRVRYEDQDRFAEPSRYRILSQLKINSGYEYGDDQVGDHVWGEFELLETPDEVVIRDEGVESVTASLTQYGWQYAYGYSEKQVWRLRLSIGQTVGGLETIWDTSFFEEDLVDAGLMTAELCRTKDYDNFSLGGDLSLNGIDTFNELSQAIVNTGGEAVVLKDGPATLVGTGGPDRLLKTADVLHRDNVSRAIWDGTGYTLYRRFNAATSPTFNVAGDGLIQGDVLVTNTDGTIFNHNDDEDSITLTAGQAIELTDESNRTESSGWTVVSNPLSYVEKIKFSVTLGGSFGEALTVFGDDVSDSPIGRRVGVQTYDRANDAEVATEQPQLLDATVQRSRTIEADCEPCGTFFQCPCHLSTEKPFWASFVTQLPWSSHTEAGKPHLFDTAFGVERVGICGFDFFHVGVYGTSDVDQVSLEEKIEFRLLYVDRDTITVTALATITLAPSTPSSQLRVSGFASATLSAGGFDCTNFLIEGTYDTTPFLQPDHPFKGEKFRITHTS